MKRLVIAAVFVLGLAAPASADYVCWPFGGTDLLIFPSCTTSGGHRQLDVNVVSSSGAAEQNVNLNQVGGAAFALGARTGATSLSVVPDTDTNFPITTDGTAATGVAQDAGGTGAIGWLSSTVKNLRLIVTAVQGTLTVKENLQSGTILTSASATACTNVQATAGRGIEIVNSGPATSVFLQIYNDAGATCAAGTLLYGDGSTITIGAGQVILIKFPVVGIAYKLSGALTSNLSIAGL